MSTQLGKTYTIKGSDKTVTVVPVRRAEVVCDLWVVVYEYYVNGKKSIGVPASVKEEAAFHSVFELLE